MGIHTHTYILYTTHYTLHTTHYYINSIKELREKIPNIPVKPIEVLKQIYPRNSNTFSIPLPTLEDIRNIIIRAPNSHSTGHDNISMNMVKKTIHTMGPLITHLTTQIILERTFPDTFKIDKISPKHKSGKPIYDIGSYRPINNLCTIEKIIEEYIIRHLQTLTDTHGHSRTLTDTHRHSDTHTHTQIPSQRLKHTQTDTHAQTHTHTHTHTHRHTHTHTHTHAQTDRQTHTHTDTHTHTHTHTERHKH